MRPVALTVGGEALSLTLDLSALDEVAGVERDFMKIAVGFTAGGTLDWRVTRAILSAALRPHKGALSRFVAERGALEAHEAAGRLFLAAMSPEEEAEPGNGEAGAVSLPSGDSPSASTSAPAR